MLSLQGAARVLEVRGDPAGAGLPSLPRLGAQDRGRGAWGDYSAALIFLLTRRFKRHKKRMRE